MIPTNHPPFCPDSAADEVLLKAMIERDEVLLKAMIEHAPSEPAILRGIIEALIEQGQATTKKFADLQDTIDQLENRIEHLEEKQKNPAER